MSAVLFSPDSVAISSWLPPVSLEYFSQLWISSTLHQVRIVVLNILADVICEQPLTCFFIFLCSSFIILCPIHCFANLSAVGMNRQGSLLFPKNDFFYKGWYLRLEFFIRRVNLVFSFFFYKKGVFFYKLNCKINSTIGGTFSKSAEKNIFIFFLFQGASVMSK